MSAVKIVCVSGASFSWGPLFIRALILTPELAASRIVLHDIDRVALDLVYRVGRLAIEAGACDFELAQTADLAEAPDGADFVILTISTGSLPPALHAIVSRYVSNQERIVAAALSEDVTLARQALLNDPLVTLPPETAVAMLDEMLQANKAYLQYL